VALGFDAGPKFQAVLRTIGISGTQQAVYLAKEIEVSAGNELIISRGARILTRLSRDQIAQRLAWAGFYTKDGWLAFRGQTLDKVVTEFNLHNERQLKIADPRTGRIQVGGKFRETDLEGFVAALGVTHGVKATLSGPQGDLDEVIILTGGSSQPLASEELREMDPQE
jgi:ferric-dicitrate binding protein FerR (iron transport regulator)